MSRSCPLRHAEVSPSRTESKYKTQQAAIAPSELLLGSTRRKGAAAGHLRSVLLWSHSQRSHQQTPRYFHTRASLQPRAVHKNPQASSPAHYLGSQMVEELPRYCRALRAAAETCIKPKGRGRGVALNLAHTGARHLHFALQLLRNVQRWLVCRHRPLFIASTGTGHGAQHFAPAPSGRMRPWHLQSPAPEQ